MRMNRRTFLKVTGGLAVTPSIARSQPLGTLVNDVHSGLNPTRVARIVDVVSRAEIQAAIEWARGRGEKICVAGGRHAMGAQQFAAEAVLLGTTGLKRVLEFDLDRGTVEVEAGVQWPELIQDLRTRQQGNRHSWSIIQKQTGADRLSLGGALSANIHGRGLRLKPFCGDIESFTMVDAEGRVRTCDRRQNPELFRLAVGGYGLFGIIYSIKLRLVPRRKLRRVVEIKAADELISAFDERVADGFAFGDFQFSIDERSDDFLRKGVFSCYQPVDDATPISETQKSLRAEDWTRLLYLAHTDRRRVFEEYASYYLSSNGQIYWSDTHQLSTYIDHYHPLLDQKLKASDPATEIITEVYVPRRELAPFMKLAAEELRKRRAELIYGTVRLIEKDDETFLPWAKDSYACIIFNLHTVHTPAGLEKSAGAFRGLIDLARGLGGSYFLTYHKYANREQLLACYPKFPEFLRLKKVHDPDERFESDWYRHYRRMLADLV